MDIESNISKKTTPIDINYSTKKFKCNSEKKLNNLYDNYNILDYSNGFPNNSPPNNNLIKNLCKNFILNN